MVRMKRLKSLTEGRKLSAECEVRSAESGKGTIRFRHVAHQKSLESNSSHLARNSRDFAPFCTPHSTFRSEGCRHLTPSDALCRLFGERGGLRVPGGDGKCRLLTANDGSLQMPNKKYYILTHHNSPAEPRRRRTSNIERRTSKAIGIVVGIGRSMFDVFSTSSP